MLKIKGYIFYKHAIIKNRYLNMISVDLQHLT